MSDRATRVTAELNRRLDELQGIIDSGEADEGVTDEYNRIAEVLDWRS